MSVPVPAPPPRPRDFSFVVPEDWYRIQVDEPAHRKHDVNRLVGMLVGARSDRDSLAPQLRGFLDDAIEAYSDRTTVEIYLSMLRIESAPIGCALVLNMLAGGPYDDPVAARTVFQATAGLDATEAGVLEVDGTPVTWARRRTGAEVDGSHKYETEVVQYQFLVPGANSAVLLTFSTPQLALLKPLRAIFDAVAESFRWVW